MIYTDRDPSSPPTVAQGTARPPRIEPSTFERRVRADKLAEGDFVTEDFAGYGQLVVKVTSVSPPRAGGLRGVDLIDVGVVDSKGYAYTQVYAEDKPVQTYAEAQFGSWV